MLLFLSRNTDKEKCQCMTLFLFSQTSTKHQLFLPCVLHSYYW